MRIVSFSGSMGVGKDTYADELIKLGESQGLKCLKIPFALPLKKEVEDFAIDLFHTSFEDLMDRHKLSLDELFKIVKVLSEYHIEDVREFTKNPCGKGVVSRKMLQFWGTEIRRAADEKYWLDKFVEQLKNAESCDVDLVVISDARFLNELLLIKAFKGFNCLIWASDDVRYSRVHGRDKVLVGEGVENHLSEQEFLNFDKYDFILNNDLQGLDYVQTDVVGILREVLG